MIVKGARIAGFLLRPEPAVVTVLLFGPDAGLIRERAETLVRAVARDPRDPFLVAELSADRLKKDPPALADEVAALSPTGERRVVRVRDAGDDTTASVSTALAVLRGALLVLEAGDLGKRSPLRTLVESADNAAAIGCYADEGGDLRTFIQETLGEAGVRLDGDALAFLMANLGSDRLATRAEIEKLILYAGGAGRLNIDDVAACVGDGGVTSLDALADAVAGGEVGAVDAALERVWSEGQSPVAVVRGISRHFLRLHLAVGLVAAGATAEQAIASLRPPLFFKYRAAFLRQMERWSRQRLAEALRQLNDAEIDCKSSGVPAAAACSRALLRLAARRPAGGARRRP